MKAINFKIPCNSPTLSGLFASTISSARAADQLDASAGWTDTMVLERSRTWRSKKKVEMECKEVSGTKRHVIAPCDGLNSVSMHLDLRRDLALDERENIFEEGRRNLN